MPNTVNIERHKLNQAMYQKLKRYIMSKRKREFEEKAQDAHFKKLRREREERKKQAEQVAENLEETRLELATTRKKIKELTTRRNELFQRWKQLGSEESSMKEKQKNETLSLLASMPSIQFGMNSTNMGNTPRPVAPSNVSRSHTPAHIPTNQLPSVQSGKAFGLGANVSGSLVNLPIQQHAHSHYSSPTTQQDLSSPYRNPQNPSYTFPNSKSSQIPLTASTQMPCTTLSSNHAAAMAAVAAALAAQHRPGSATDSVLSTTAAAAAYLNAIVSLTSTPSASVPALVSNPLGILNPNSAGFSEAVAALAASGLYTLPSLPITTAPSCSSSGGTSVNSGLPFGHRSSPTVESSFSRDTALTSTQAAAAVVAALAQQSASLSKSFAMGQRFSNSGGPSVETNANGFNVVSSSPVTTTTMATAPNSSLPPAPISYRGSIITGQSAQQIQLQQQQQQQHHTHQKQQQHLLNKYPSVSEFASNRGGETATHTALTSTGRTAQAPGRFADAAALMASIGVTAPSQALFNAAVFQAGFPSTTAAVSATNALPTNTSPVALTAVLAPYAAELNHLSYLTTANLAAALQQQQQLQQQQFQKMNVSCGSPSPRNRASPASSGSSSAANTPALNANSRSFF